jgi:thiol-disulfide isomerase/thioredoxin/copper chaperone CopZ
MGCPTCTSIIEKELKKLAGVKDVRVNFLMRKVVVTYDPKEISVPDLEKRIEELGFRLSYKKYEGFIGKFSRALLRKEEETAFRRIADREFDDLVVKSNKPVVLFFTSPTCPPCKTLKPRLKATLEKFSGRVYLYEMDIMTTKKWEDYNVMSVPALLFLKEGRMVGRQENFPKQEEIEEMILKELNDT